MIKKIPAGQLRIGMYINDLDHVWAAHPFAWNCFTIEDAATLDEIIAAGIAEIEIDTEHGGPTEKYSEPSTHVPNLIANLSPAGQFNYAKALYFNASKLMEDLMRDVRSGKKIAIEHCEPVVENILDSMYNFPSAFLPLAQIKNRDEYTFQHSVSVSALMVAFGRVLEMPRHEIKELALGGLLHDVGKAKIPQNILNKPGKLDEAEFILMKHHATDTADLLSNAKGLSEIALNAASQHHERYDGTGYPQGLKGDQISLHGQMLAIADVYDAITSLRVYHKGMPPTEALRKMYEWSGSHFNPHLVQAFIKGVGIYPAGSLVRLESDRLGIVRIVMPDNLLQPVVQLIYDCKKACAIHPVTVDLSGSNDKIKSHESFEKWGIDQARWSVAHV